MKYLIDTDWLLNARSGFPPDNLCYAHGTSGALTKVNAMVTLKLDPQSDIARALETVDTEPVVLVSNGERFQVSRDETNPADHDDPEAFEEALRAVVGTLTPEEGERLKRDIYRWREEGTRPIDRP